MESYSAYPVIAPEHGPIMTGLSKKELFSIHILHGLVSDYDAQSKTQGRFIPATDYEELAKQSVELACALMNELQRVGAIDSKPSAQ
jgi:hypothetical protein